MKLPFTKSEISIKFPDGDVLKKLVTRWFENESEAIVVTGDQEEHEVWLVSGTKIQLLGTLTLKCYKQIHRLRKGSLLELDLNNQNFEWIKATHPESLSARAVSPYHLEKRVNLVYAYED